MGCGTACCRSYVQFMNLIVMLIGAGIVGIALYLIIDQTASAFLGTSAGPWVQYTTLALGIVTIIFASVGCCLVNSLSKCRLTLYGILLFLIGAVVVIAGAATIVYKDYSTTIAIASSTTFYPDIAAGIFGTQQYLADYEAGLYSGCCTNGNFVVQPCADLTTASVCYFNWASYSAGLATDQNTCDVFVNDLDLCFTSDGNDAGFTLFTIEFEGFMHDYVYPSGIAFIVMGGLLVLASIGTCVLACKNRRAKFPKAQHQQAQNVTGTKAPPATGGPVARV